MTSGRGTIPAGQPRAVVLDGATTWFWWGRDVHDTGDAVAVDARRRAMTWNSGEDALAAADEHGWVLADEETRRGAEEVTDLVPAQEWLSGGRLALPTAAVLGLWGWAGDVAASTGTPWADRGGVRDRCYDKLFAAEVPAFFDLEAHRPSWTAHELDALRAVAGTGVRVLRSAAPRGRSWRTSTRPTCHVLGRRCPRSLPVT